MGGLQYATIVAIIYGSMYVIAVLFATVLSYLETKALSSKKTCMTFWKLLYAKKRMYGPVFVHIFDTASDIGVLIQWYQEAIRETNTDYDVPHLDMMYMFAVSLSALIVYRIVSSVWIYRLTGKISWVFLQLLDLLLFKAIYVNWKLNRNKPSNPQKYLQKLEGIFESTPQALLQFVYCIKRGSFTSSPLVSVSLLFSMVSLSMRQISDDKILFHQDAQDLDFHHTRCPPVSYGYLTRAAFRFVDVTHRFTILSLVWIALGGSTLFIVIGAEFLVLAVWAYRERNQEILQGIVALVLEFQRAERFCTFLMYFRFGIENIVFMTLVSVWIFVSFECPTCPSYDDRSSFVIDTSIGKFVLIYAYLGIALLPPLFIATINWMSSPVSVCTRFRSTEDVDDSAVKHKVEKIMSTDRDLASVLLSHDFEGFEELIAFGANISGYRDNVRRFTLLHLCCLMYRAADNKQPLDNVIEAILDTTDQDIHDLLWDSKNGPQQTVLHCACLGAAWKMVEFCLKDQEQCDEYINALDANEQSPLLYAALSGDGKLAEFLKEKGAQTNAKIESILRAGQQQIIFLGGIGAGGSSVLLKQLEILYGDGFPVRKRHFFQKQINEQCIEGMKLCISFSEELWERYDEDGSFYEDFELHVDDDESHAKESWMSLNMEDNMDENTQTAEFLLGIRSNQKWADDVVNALKVLWENAAIQWSYKYHRYFAVPETCKYFWNDMDRLSNPEYIPSDEDILKIRYRTTGMQEKAFVIGDTAVQVRDVGKQRNERRKWIHFYSGVGIMFWISSLTSYDERTWEDDENTMKVDLEVLEQMIKSEYMENVLFVLLFSKKDLLEQALSEVPFKKRVPEYDGQNTYEDVVAYLKKRYEILFERDPSKLYGTFVINLLDTTEVEAMARKIWNF